MSEYCIRGLKALLGYKELKQAKNGITIRSLKEKVKEWDRCIIKIYGKNSKIKIK